jgi:hypothetical protein
MFQTLVCTFQTLVCTFQTLEYKIPLREKTSSTWKKKILPLFFFAINHYLTNFAAREKK